MSRDNVPFCEFHLNNNKANFISLTKAVHRILLTEISDRCAILFLEPHNGNTKSKRHVESEVWRNTTRCRL